MLAALRPLDAYRADLAEHVNTAAFGSEDGTWLLVAELTARLAAKPDEANVPLRALLNEAVGTPPWPDPTSDRVAADTALSTDLMVVAERMEEGGALRLAYAMLGLAERAAAAAAEPQQAMILARRARVARKLGDLEVADDLYDEAAALARSARDALALTWATLGKGVVARMRGNYPAARAFFRKGLAMAQRAGSRELEGVAHHGLLIAAGVAGDFDTALQHGWAAVSLAGDDSERQAELLFNMAAASSDAGFDAAALQGYLAAAARLTAPRLRLPALAGAAVSAARLGEAARLRAITSEIHRELAGDALPYERAQALTLLAEAWATHEPDGGGQPYRDQALAVAAPHQFHEIVHRAERIGVVQAPERRLARPVAAPTRKVLDALESLPEAVESHALATGITSPGT